MGTLYIDRKDLTVKTRDGALMFYSESGVHEGNVPMNPLKRVVVVGDIAIGASVLHALGERGVTVAFLSGKHLRYRGHFTGPIHNNGILRMRQYAFVMNGGAGAAARDIVRRKLSGQRDVLADARERRPDLRFALTKAIGVIEKGVELLDREPDLPMHSVRGIEGGAAASYFGAFTEMFPPSLEFTKRNRRPPEDPVNAMLSLIYTMLHLECLREIQVIGLDPTIGVYHAFEYGRESLACDMIELFRPVADAWVWELFREREFAARDFSSGGERPGTYLKKEGRKRFFQLYEEWVRTVRSGITAEVRALASRIMDDGQNSLP